MWLDVNGQRMQTGSTRTMIFGVATLVSYVSQFMTLMPGDVITTGTPPGVGLGMKPPRLSQGGRRDDAGHRGPGRAAAGRGAVQALMQPKRPCARAAHDGGAPLCRACVFLQNRTIVRFILQTIVPRTPRHVRPAPLPAEDTRRLRRGRSRALQKGQQTKAAIVDAALGAGHADRPGGPVDRRAGRGHADEQVGRVRPLRLARGTADLGGARIPRALRGRGVLPRACASRAACRACARCSPTG